MSIFFDITFIPSPYLFLDGSKDSGALKVNHFDFGDNTII
jgi:hypothetical protein